MSIRRQSIISSLVIYIGFFIGLLNIYFFTRPLPFKETEYGLYNGLIAIATMMMSFASLAMPAYIYKFYPYYKAHLPAKKSDMLTISLVAGLVGFLLVSLAAYLMRGLVIRKYSENSQELIDHYNLIYPLAFGLVMYTILEAYTWQLRRSVLTNFLKEVLWRLFTTGLIILYMYGVIKDFNLFIRLFSFSFIFIAVVLLVYLITTGKLHFHFRISKVTRRFSKSIFRLLTFVYGGSVIFTVSQVFDSLLIGSVVSNGMGNLGVYSVAQNMAAVIQAPQRGIVAASIPHLAEAWREKNMQRLQAIYQRSSINQLLFAGGLYCLLVLNFTDAVETFKLKGAYLDAYYVVLFLGLCKVVDMGTGVNSQIIGTSTWWRFEMVSGVILLVLMLPLSYIFTKQWGIIGTGAAQLVSISVYNLVRIVFLWKKFRLFPFTIHTIQAILVAGACYAACYFGLREIHGLAGLFIRSIAFIICYATAAIYLKLSPDIQPVLQSVKKRMRW